MGRIGTAIFDHLVRCRRPIFAGADPGADLFPEALMRNTEDGGFPDARMAEEKFLDLGRVDILASADDHVLGSADDGAAPGLVEDRKVASVHPPVFVDRLARALGI